MAAFERRRTPCTSMSPLCPNLNDDPEIAKIREQNLDRASDVFQFGHLIDLYPVVAGIARFKMRPNRFWASRPGRLRCPAHPRVRSRRRRSLKQRPSRPEQEGPFWRSSSSSIFSVAAAEAYAHQ